MSITKQRGAGKRMGRKKATKNKNDKEKIKRVWHRYQPETLQALHELKSEITKQIPFFMHGHIDDPSIITALIHKARVDMEEGKFNVQEYFSRG